MGVRRGGQEGALALPSPAQPNYYVSQLFWRKIISVKVFLGKKYVPPPGKFCPHMEKSLRTLMVIANGWPLVQ